MSKRIISSNKLRQRDRDLMSKIEPDSGKGTTQFCAQCLDEVVSLENTIAYCVWCKDFLCSEACLKLHAKFRLTKSHRYAMGDELITIIERKCNSMPLTSASDDDKKKTQALIPQLRTEINIRNKDDPEICSVYASVVLESGRIVLADLKNNKLKLFDVKLKQCLATHALAGCPRDLCLSNVRGDEIYAIDTGTDGLLHLRVSEFLLIVRKIPIAVDCFGIACWSGGIAVTASEFKTYRGKYELRLLDYTGNTIKKFTPYKVANLEFSLPWYLASSADGRRIFISDYENHTITCIDTDGIVAFVYKDESLTRPVSMAIGLDDDVFIVGQRSHNVHHISSSGEKKGVIFSSASARLEFPGGIAFDAADDVFYIQCVGWSDLIQMFNFTPKSSGSNT